MSGFNVRYEHLVSMQEDDSSLGLLRDVNSVKVDRVSDANQLGSRNSRAHKYKITSGNEQLFYLREQEPIKDDDFQVVALDQFQQEVFNIKRFNGCFLDCVFQGKLASVQINKQDMFTIHDDGSWRFWSGSANNVSVYPFCCACSWNRLIGIRRTTHYFTFKNEYEISLPESEQKGCIKKLGEGFGSGGNAYKVNFPEGIDVNSKILILSCVILFDFLHFSDTRRTQNVQHTRNKSTDEHIV